MSWRVNTSADAASSFSPDYRTARARFRDAAERLGWACNAYPTGSAGPEGEELTIDVAASSPDATQRVLVISSGLHGIEGFLGSAVQLALLNRWRRQAGPPKGIRCVMLHALNPYGFAWSRRCDADNIDPNRNFLLDGVEYRGSADAYARLDGLLNPRRPPSRWDLFYPKAFWQLARLGRPALKDAIVTGQYDFPAGLFFGGSGPSRTRQILQQHMRSWIGGATSVVHLDLHTGLGAWGTYRLLTDDTPSPEQRNWIARTFGPGAHEEGDSRSVAYEARGSLGRWCRAQNFAPEYLMAFAEFGTYGNVRVLAGLRAENQAHHWGRAQDLGTLRAKARLRELFCPASTQWRTRALTQGTELVEKAIGGMIEIPHDSPWRDTDTIHQDISGGRQMITEYVLFDVPKTMSREQVVAGMRAVAPKWRATPDLIRKTFVYDPEARQTGAFYLWKNKAAAVRAHDEAWRRGVRENFGSEPVIRYFQTPLVVDNALQETIEETV